MNFIKYFQKLYALSIKKNNRAFSKRDFYNSSSSLRILYSTISERYDLKLSMMI